MTVAGLTDRQMLERAVTNARSHHRRGRHPRWLAVMEVFNVGSMDAKDLCKLFGLDPDEQVIP